MPAVDRPGGRRAAHAARDAEHDADQHGPTPGLGRVDERLGPLDVEDVAIGAEAAMLGVEVADRVVARRALREVRVEAARLRRRDVPPARLTLRGRARAALGPPPSARPSRGSGRGTGGGGRRARAGRRERATSAPVRACTRSARRRGNRGRHPDERADRGEKAEQEDLRFRQSSLSAAGRNSGRRPGLLQCALRGCSSMVEPQPSKLITRVRFPPPASFSTALGMPIPERQRPRLRGLISLYVRIVSGIVRVLIPVLFLVGEVLGH